jgi:hypothetical protein
MARKDELPPSLAVRAFYEALLEAGVRPGQTFEGESWDDLLIVGFDVLHHQTLRQYTRLGRAHQLWEVQVGGGRGNKTRVTMLAPPAPLELQAAALPQEALAS